MKKKTFFHLLFAVLVLQAISQNENKIWYFGTFAGLDFNTNPPTVLTNSSLHSIGGSSSVSDAAGNLLFYTDGKIVYNKNHTTMDNGLALDGTGGSVISVKKPGSQNIYYVFSLGGSSNPPGLEYGVIDMSLAGGQGSVTVSKVSVQAAASDILAATKHCNGTDVWVIGQEHGTNIFRSHLVTAAGVSAAVASSTIGVAQSTAIGSYGEMKFSPDGRKLGMAWYNGDIELYDFDPASGIISNRLQLSQGYHNNYGCEFSPDGTKFYVSRFGLSGTGSMNGDQLMQWDLCAGSPSAIVASQYTISTPSTLTPQDQCAGMRLGSDGKIYISPIYQQSLSVINNPNASGSACGFSPLSFPIFPKYVAFSFPLIVIDPPAQTTATLSGPVTWTPNCQVVSFTPPPGAVVSQTCGSFSQAASSLRWLFGDGTNPAATSTLVNPQFVYAGTGTYTSKLVLYYPCRTDTLYTPVTVTHTAPVISVSGRTEICKGEQTILTASGASTYSWNGTAGSSSMALTPTVSGYYTISGSIGSSVCATTSTLVAVTVLGCDVLNEEGQTRFSAFPNPFTHSIAIESSQPGEVFITDISGKRVMTLFIPGGRNNIDTSSLEEGLYFFHFCSGNNTKVLKVIKANTD